ncbi:hypothetical protein LS66_001595 [Helicobacter sp. MIT 03-1614]|jgi:hypothetical protein|uniref:Uncharacterized protein n=1 Tax=Helicobacter hepaticus (strain ATCC 51449 / 3B1) TaxID=235279 RepID=Q7VF63_HELHP|nr:MULTISPECIES: hypothetical protein [Helicobacter]AAP78411.1 conserved hypothetical protein [Helicobacter hepaticus ATCC 51449]TLD90586.1 hypothetical protein LS66_001595 [Helicobacter sp. MIT 03-1614]
MQVFLKLLFAAIVGSTWYHFGGGDAAMALIFFFVILGVLFMKPIRYQDPKRREEYMQRIRDSRERKIALENERLEELRRLKKNALEQEEKLKKDFEQRINKR